jgi:outer membrane lipoprotein LolB
MRWLALLATVALLSACATPQRAVQPGEELWSGRLAMTVQSDPPQSFSAGFELRGTPEAGELQLTSPLGTSIATVTWLPGSAEMRQGGQVTRRGSLDALTTELSGTPVPVAALFGWLRGRAGDVPGWQADLTRQTEGRITARRISPTPIAELRVVVQP